MRKLSLFVWFIGLSISMAACSPKLLSPGDKIDEMELFSYCDGVNVVDICTFDELNEGTCQVPGSPNFLWVSTGWVEPTIAELESAWKDSTWKMTFDGQAVNLAEFGTYDLKVIDPDYGPVQARVWNFCISNPTPGVHTARYDYHFVNGSRPGNNATVWTFTVLEGGATTP